MISIEDVVKAEGRIRPYIVETPLEYSPYLSEQTGAEVWLKLEHIQTTGSFKIRGAANKLLTLKESQWEGDILTASTGNHGAAVAYMAQKLGMSATIYLPEATAATKVEALKQLGANLIMHGKDSLEPEIEARRQAELRSDAVFISPYNDREVAAGQGTIGVELERQLPDLDTVLVPVGGGGLISGIAVYLKSQKAQVQVIGCQPSNSAVMHASIQAGKVLDLPSLPTLSDGTAGGIEEDSITFEICQQWVDDYVRVSEKEIANALRLLLTQHYLMVEGAAGLSVATLLQQAHQFEGKRVVLILCGRKLGLKTLQMLVSDFSTPAA